MTVGGIIPIWKDVLDAVQNKKSNPVQFRRYFLGEFPEKSSKKPEKQRRRKRFAVRGCCLGSRFDYLCLTPRETDCMALLLKGYTNERVAEELKLSARTVEFYIKNMRQKLGCHNKAHLIQTVRLSEFSYEVWEKMRNGV